MNRNRVVDELKRIIYADLVRVEPHCFTGVGAGAVFTGSFDWHSSVHAHWALLSMARLTHDVPLQRKLLSRLTPENIEAERTFLNDVENLGFEMPYGRAWLLLMLAELSKYEESNYLLLDSFREELEQQLTLWLEKNSASDKVILNGAYQPWLFIFLLLQLSQPKLETLHRLEALRPQIENVRETITTTQAEESDSFYLPAILFLVDQTKEPSEKIFSYCDDATPQLNQNLSFKNCHQAGINVVRLWPYALDSPSKGGSSRFFKGLEGILSQPDQWRGSFELISHWVPQFIWLGLMLEQGELLENYRSESSAIT
ncbi:DUF2891 family protein [Microcoleus sp. FACHB-1515]|uniref:DUF2891 family protein n=1 Tax=Cyanophyceae TaxID=3028117 RepID=UPI001685AE5E|nr:DUF2891 family protein [Microcoleus sp. FACHB-1515]MBD2093323.1 DUF2891 family protein [Microcoleus sp. FACHB-1515]